MSSHEGPRRFKLRLLVLLPAYLVFAQLWALVISLLVAAASFDRTGQMFLNAYLAFGLLAAVAAWSRVGVIAVWHRIEVGPEGIRARPGPVEPVYWDAIRTVRVIRWSVLSYLELETRKERKHRFPLYVADLPGFVEAVERFAGEDHPLTWALWEWTETE